VRHMKGMISRKGVIISRRRIIRLVKEANLVCKTKR